MNEEKIKKRGWVKNAAIIFLSVLLVLTFFSKTILDWSLPEVAVQTVTSGNISVQIRGNSTVKATETFSVIVQESRLVRSVNVRVGDQVSVGDLIAVLSDESSEELKNAEAQLKEATRNLKEIQLSGGTTQEYRNLIDAKEALAEAQKKFAGMDNRDALLAEAQIKVDAAKAETAAAQAEVDAAKANVEAANAAVTAANNEKKAINKLLSKYINGYPDLTEDAVEALKDTIASDSDEVRIAGVELELATQRYQSYYNNVVKEAAYRIRQTAGYKALSDKTAQQQYIDDRIDVYTADEFERVKAGTSDLVLKWGVQSYDPETGEWYTVIDDDLQTEYIEGYTKYKAALDNYNEALRKYGLANGEELPLFITRCEDALKAIAAADEELDAAQDELEAKNEELSKKKEAQQKAEQDYKDIENSDYAAIEKEITQLKRNVTDAERSYDLAAYEYANRLDDAREAVAKAEADVAKYTGVGTGTEIHSEVNGVVKSVNISSGYKTNAGEAVCTIEVPDRGYTAEMSVTMEQSQRVLVGDYANVQIGWWYGGSDVKARLVAIRNDPQNPRTNRLLVFEITGSDVNSGDNLTITIGERTRTYDTVVPKSAMRSDTNGDYILLIEARQSPIGNRYTAKRIDVTKLAEDDVNVAISGDLSYNDVVITTATAPIENGMQVRMAGK